MADPKGIFRCLSQLMVVKDAKLRRGLTSSVLNLKLVLNRGDRRRLQCRHESGSLRVGAIARPQSENECHDFYSYEREEQGFDQAKIERNTI